MKRVDPAPRSPAATVPMRERSRSAAGSRTIVIGDVHGCHGELLALLDKIGPVESDEIICVGDLVRKGPESAAVIDWVMRTPNVSCVLGNHEVRLLEKWFSGELPGKDPEEGRMVRRLGDSLNGAMEFIRSWPLHLERDGFLVVHAGLDPRIPSLGLQSPHDLLTIRVPEGMDDPWYESYTGETTVVFGHWARPEPVVRENAIGLDTGCVYGGRLTAVILPERNLVSVPAKRAYSGK